MACNTHRRSAKAKLGLGGDSQPLFSKGTSMAIDAIDRGPGGVERESRGFSLNDPNVRSVIYQALLALLVVYLAWSGWTNLQANLAAQSKATGFGFLDNPAGFTISQTFIDYSSSTSTYGRVFLVGLVNTLVVSAIGIVLATILGFVFGVARLSTNFVVRIVSTSYVEVVRNTPLLLQIFIWYFAILTESLPGARDPIDLGAFGLLNVGGWYAPRPIFGEGSSLIFYAFLIGLVAAYLISRWAKARQMRTGQTFPTFWTTLALVVGLPLIVFLAMGAPLTFEFPEQGRFRPSGGARLSPEFIALLLALTFYTAAFIAEIVRAGILAVNRGQTEASYALGLRPGKTLRLVVIPQAMRVIIPPLTSQYLNLTKNSSLAVAIAYPDLVAVFAGTALNQAGQEVEFILITLLTYLTISLTVSAVMNWYNRRVALVER